MSNQSDATLTFVAVVMAVYAPERTYLSRQFASIADQSHPAGLVVVVDADRRSEILVRELATQFAIPLHVVRPESQTSSVKSFEIGLEAALCEARSDAVFALCDQDDIWHRDKLAQSVRALKASNAGLVHTDARVVDASGRVIHPSLFKLERRQATPDLRALLLKNSVTGMTSVMTREVVRAALPFPRQAALFFHHDLWLALVAETLGGIGFVGARLVDYRQHDNNVVGTTDRRATSSRFGSAAWFRHWAGTYSVAAYLAKCLYLRMEEVTASGLASPDRRKLGWLRPYLALRSPGPGFVADAIRLTLAGRLALAGQSVMFAAVRIGRLAWALRASLSGGLVAALSEFDRRAFLMAPGNLPGLGASASSSRLPQASVWSADDFRDARTSPRFAVQLDPGLPGRMVIAVPTLNPSEIFAGVATAIDLGVGLIERGVDVVFLATDLPVASHDRSRSFVVARAKGALTGGLELACAVGQAKLTFSPDDRFLATAWWSAHLVSKILENGFTFSRFYYLIQDYEPGFYAWGAEYAGALASYKLDHIPIYNSTLLRDYFVSLGLTPKGPPPLVFHPAIDTNRYAALKRPVRGRKRLAFYGRPEVARNLFPVGIEAIDRFLKDCRIAPHEIELVSVGLPHPDVRFRGGHVLHSLGKIPWEDYPAFLAGVDIGVALMLSPHPSHLPLEMAAAGARVVTNAFSTKDLGEISLGILSVEPTPEEVAGAIAASWAAPELTRTARELDLHRLGRPLGDVIASLAEEVSRQPVHMRAKA